MEPLKKDDLLERIDSLASERACFALAALMLAGHVTRDTMERTLILAETVKVNYDY